MPHASINTTTVYWRPAIKGSLSEHLVGLRGSLVGLGLTDLPAGTTHLPHWILANTSLTHLTIHNTYLKVEVGHTASNRSSEQWQYYYLRFLNLFRQRKPKNILYIVIISTWQIHKLFLRAIFFKFYILIKTNNPIFKILRLFVHIRMLYISFKNI